MLALRKKEPARGLVLEELDEPSDLAPGEVLVEVDAVGICGSDVHVYEWTSGYDWMRQALPVTLGHEFAGRVVARAPDVEDVPVGQRVTVWPSSGCGRCRNCLSGEIENCLRKRTVGLARDGAFARRVAVPATGCFALPDHLDAELAALTEPLCVGARAVEVGDVRLGEAVVVLGPGTIGQAIAMFARRSGAGPVIVVGRDDGPRLETVRRLGIAHTIDVAHEDLATAVAAITGGKVDKVFEATGVPASIRDGLGLLRKGGAIVATGIHAAPLEINLTDLVRNKHQLRGSHGSRPRTWDAVLRVLSESGEEFRPMITHRIPLSEGIEGFELARRKVASKVMIEPGRG